MTDLLKDTIANLVLLFLFAVVVGAVLFAPVGCVFETFGAPAPSFTATVAFYFVLFTSVAFTAIVTRMAMRVAD